jgi:uncharacterized membrane protein
MMRDPDLFVLARVLHVLGVVLWIGGVAFVTTVLLPALRDVEEPARRLETFERLEGRFAFQARIVTLVTGLTGFYLLHYLDAWDRYLRPEYWWIPLMTLVWAAFTLVLFVLEPLFLHRWFREKATAEPDRAFRVAQAMHIVLLSLSLLAVFGAVAGSHGWSFRWP